MLCNGKGSKVKTYPLHLAIRWASFLNGNLLFGRYGTEQAIATSRDESKPLWSVWDTHLHCLVSDPLEELIALAISAKRDRVFFGNSCKDHATFVSHIMGEETKICKCRVPLDITYITGGRSMCKRCYGIVKSAPKLGDVKQPTQRG